MPYININEYDNTITGPKSNNGYIVAIPINAKDGPSDRWITVGTYDEFVQLFGPKIVTTSSFGTSWDYAANLLMREMPVCVRRITHELTEDGLNTITPLSGVASLSAPEPRLVTISPWDASQIPAIEKAIQNSQMGFNPSNDGKIIRVPFPQLTEERRKELVKIVKKMGEDAKVAIRNERRDANDKIKKQEKDKEISEDDAKKLQDDVQKVTDDAVKRIDEITAVKEKEVMEI